MDIVALSFDVSQKIMFQFFTRAKRTHPESSEPEIRILAAFFSLIRNMPAFIYPVALVVAGFNEEDL